MKMKALTVHRHFLGLLAVTSLFLVARCWSEDFYLERYENYGISEKDFDQMRILPTHMMDSDTLFEAARAQRETSMSMSQRILNNRWLLNQGKANHSGAEGLRKYLRLYFIDNWKQQNKSSKRQSTDYLPVVRKNAPSQFQDLSNYNLRVSDDKVNVKFKYRFD